jgi:sporulation protein YabP
MEEKQGTGQHRLTLNQRRSGSFSGILDVVSFDLNEILLETDLGMLQIRGKELHVNRLDLTKGEVEIAGTVEALTYSQAPRHKNKGSMLGKLFGL